LRWGSLPGAYLDSKSQRKPGNVVIGAKQLHTMEALVRDYSKPGDLICDPCAGGATTALAAIGLGRRFVGAEIDPDTHAKAMKRLSGGYQMELLA
jgi:site-specific DNA-methyltransferase (adenine-specific)